MKNQNFKVIHACLFAALILELMIPIKSLGQNNGEFKFKYSCPPLKIYSQDMPSYESYLKTQRNLGVKSTDSGVISKKTTILQTKVEPATKVKKNIMLDPNCSNDKPTSAAADSTSILKAQMEGYRVKMPPATDINLQNGITIGGATLSLIGHTATMIKIQNKKDAMLLLSYADDADQKIQLIAIDALIGNLNVPNNGLSIPTHLQHQSPEHKALISLIHDYIWERYGAKD